jgi:hypothetical protein
VISRFSNINPTPAPGHQIAEVVVESLSKQFRSAFLPEHALDYLLQSTKTSYAPSVV